MKLGRQKIKARLAEANATLETNLVIYDGSASLSHRYTAFGGIMALKEPPLSKKEQTEYGIKAGHSPVAAKVVCVDFDATLFPWGHLFDDDAVPEPGAVRAMQDFDAAGFTVVIFTSRMSRTWLAYAGEDRDKHHSYITRLCRKWGIPFDRIIGEKIPAIAYIDDKAVEYDGTNWDSIRERILSLATSP